MSAEPTPRRSFSLPPNRARIEAELQDEFRFHIEERIEQFVADGMTREQAELEVARRFGNYEAHRALTQQIDEDTMHQRKRMERWRDVQREVRLAWRSLIRAPGFAAVALITLALGIGATTAIFTVLDAVVLRPLAYRNAEQLVSILHPATVPGSGERKWGLSAGGYFNFKAANHSFSSMAMYRNSSLTVTNGGTADVAQLSMVTSTIFPVLQARAAYGRLLTDADDQPGAPGVVVLSDEFFKRRFGGDPSTIGKNLETSAGTFQIVGVAEPGLRLPMPGPFESSGNLAGLDVDVWLPVQENPNGPFFNSHPYVGLARLNAGVTIDAAQRDLATIFARFPELMPRAYSPGFIKQYNFRIEVSALRNAVLGPRIPRTLWMLFGAVSLVLLIAAANVSNLFMVRMEARRRDAAIRNALGADRAQMATHFLSETMLLATTAALLSVILAAIGLRALLAIAPADIPRLSAVTLSWRSVTVALAIAAILGALLGVLPLFRRGIDLGTLRDGGRGLSASPRQRAVRSALVVGQMALALMLLSAAGLMLRSFDRLRHVKPGFSADHVLAFDISLPFTEYKSREAAAVFHRELQRRIAELQGVASVGSVGSVPLETFGTGCSVVFRENRPYGSDEQTPCVPTPIAAPGLFDALRIPVRGRAPTWNDVDGRTQAVVITKELGDRLWPNEDPIGKGIGSNGPKSLVWYRIVGVISEFKAEALDQPSTEAVFYPPTGLVADQQTDAINDLTYMVRTSAVDAITLVPAVRKIVAEMNPRVPVVNARSMDDVVKRSMARTSFIMILLGVAAAVALVLSAVGIYGVVSYVVTQRRTEIGIRMALGASVNEVVRLVLMQSVWLAVIGVAVGLVGAIAVTRLLQSVLFEVSPTDPVVFVGVVLLLLTIATIASFVPAKRAARIDPVEAMRAV